MLADWRAWVHLSYASVNPWPPGWSPGITIFMPWMANFQGWGLLSCQTPRGWDEKRGQMPRPPSTLQHISLMAQSRSAILSILMCDFLFQFLGNSAILFKTSRHDDMGAAGIDWCINQCIDKHQQSALHIGNTPICKFLKYETFVLLNELLQFLEF